MRLLYITANFPSGPSETFLSAEVMELVEQGHEIVIIPRNVVAGKVNAYSNTLSSHTIEAPLMSLRIILANIYMCARHPLRVFVTLISLLNSMRLSIIIKNLAVFPKGLWVAKLCDQIAIDHIHAHWAGTTSTMAMVASKVSGVPWSFTAHRWDIVENNLLQRKVRTATFARFISISGLNMAKGYIDGSLHDNMFVLHMGVHIPKSIPEFIKMYSTDRQFTILCPANLYPVKGHKYLLEAIRILHNDQYKVMLLVAGKGFLLSELNGVVAQLRLQDSVEFLGQLPHESVIDMYESNMVDCTILPSIDLGAGEHEGIPVALIEAMGYGIPVISTSTGGIPELLSDGAGILVPHKDPVALADAIKSLLNDARLGKQLSYAGYKRVIDEFSIEPIVRKLVDCIGK